MKHRHVDIGKNLKEIKVIKCNMCDDVVFVVSNI